MTIGHRIGWIVLGAVITGHLAALVAVLGPLGGAPENVITGAALLGFATGWLVLAIESEQWTGQPQRWALLPALVLGLLGSGFLLWPGVVSSAPMAWALPALMLGLAIWMTMQVRRSLQSRARQWLLYPLFGVIALAAMAALVEQGREQLERTREPVQGELVDVGGYRLHLECRGSGSPTVVLIPGAGETSAVWGWIAPAVARESQVCVYDRAGRGASDGAPALQDGVAIARDLHRAVVQRIGGAPVVLVGHSFGGLYARVFAAKYPAQVAGVVLLDATHPEMFTRLPNYPRFYYGYARVSALFPSLARFGIGRVAYHAAFDDLPAQSQAVERIWWSTAALARSQRDEWLAAPALMRQAGMLTSLGAKPLEVVTALKESQVGWLAMQQEMAGLSRNSTHRVLPAASHMSLVSHEQDAAVTTEAILDVVAAVRTGLQVRQDRVAKSALAFKSD
ncbi:MAG: alpha/beta fold hydrolase [Gemmatimonadales bacterium]